MKKINLDHKADIDRRIMRTAGGKTSVPFVNAALASALAYTGVRKNEIKCSEFSLADGIYDFTFSTDWLLYELFVDRKTGEVIGCNFEPVTVNFAMREY